MSPALLEVDAAVAAPSDAKKRIALVHVSDFGGGAERSVVALHRALNEAGHESRLFVGTKHTDEAGVIEIPRERPIPGLLRVTRYLENRRGIQALYAPWFRRLPDLIGEVDVVNVHTLWGGQFGYADLSGLHTLAKRYPTVLTLRESWMLTGHCACPFTCERWKMGCGSCPDLTTAPAVPVDSTARNWSRKHRTIQASPLHVTTVSSWMKSQIQLSPIFDGKAVDVVHNSVDESVFHPTSTTAKSEIRKKLGLPANETLVLMCGQAVEGVNTGIAYHGVDAMNEVAGGRATTLLVGHSAEKRAETCRGPFITLPFQKTPAEMADVYRAADLTVTPSEFESFGRVAAESMACGTPVVSFATGGLTDIIDDGETGWLVPTRNTQALAAAIDDALSHVDEREQRGKAAAIAAAERFSTNTIRDGYLSVFQRVGAAA